MATLVGVGLIAWGVDIGDGTRYHWPAIPVIAIAFGCMYTHEKIRRKLYPDAFDGWDEDGEDDRERHKDE